MMQAGDPEVVKASLYNPKAGYDVLMPLLKVNTTLIFTSQRYKILIICVNDPLYKILIWLLF